MLKCVILILKHFKHKYWVLIHKHANHYLSPIYFKIQLNTNDMKNLIYFLLLLVFAFTSCEQDEIIDPTSNQGEELIGTTLKGKKSVTTYVPDDGFEQILIDLEYDDVLDDYVLTENISSVENLTIFGGQSISDLTGLEDFKSLVELLIQSVAITTLDISKQKELKILRFIFVVELPMVDISKNKNLETLELLDTRFSSLNVNGNLNLKNLYLANTGISDFNISKNKNLETLYFFDNSSVTLDVSKNANLVSLTTNTSHFNSMDLSHNKNLKIVHIDDAGEGPDSLDIFKLPSITSLFIADAELTSLDISKNINLVEMNITGNPLTCIKVNKKQLDNIPAGWVKDAEDIYSLDCGS